MDENLNGFVLVKDIHEKTFKDKALQELGESAERLEDCIGQIWSWMDNEKRFLRRQEREFILKFLRYGKFDVEKTKQRIMQYYTNRRNHPDWLQNRDLSKEDILQLLNLGIFLPVNLDDMNRELIVLVHLAKYDPRIFSFDTLWKLAFMVLEICLLRDHVQINGVEVVLDLGDISYVLIRKFNFTFISRILTCVLNGMPVRMKGIHLWRAPAFFTAVVTIAKWFLTEKMKKRLHSHGSDSKSLHNVISPEVLPSEYGGSAGSIKSHTVRVQQWLLEHMEYFRNDDQYGCPK